MTFTEAPLDRAALQRRRPSWVAEGLQDPRAHAVFVTGGQVWVTRRAGAVRPWLGHPGDVEGETVLLGIVDGRPLFAVETSTESAPDTGRLASLRTLASELSPTDAGIAAYAAALLNWHRRHRFCSNCGSATAAQLGGLERHCPSCSTDHYPRTDPVVIVRVVNGDRLLLGREPGWPEGFYSVIAGYVEPGETLEHAVWREVSEETGVDVEDCRYLASQPWPFPGSLMVGFSALGSNGVPTVDQAELADARWFTRDQVVAAAAGEGEVSLPESFSIARWIIDDWLAQSHG